MTTPNEVLLARAKRLRNELDDSNARLDRQCVTAMYEMEQALQSQAERIKFLEADRNLEKKMRKDADEYADQLRAQLAEIQKAEPVGYLYDWTSSSALGKPNENFTSFAAELERALYGVGHSNVRRVFTRPMPTDSKDAERYQWLRLHGYVDSFKSHSRSDKTELSMFDAAIDAAIERAK